MNYPEWWSDTITLFNRHEDADTNVVSWYKTILHGCFVKNVINKVALVGGNTLLEANDFIVRIPENDRFRNYGDYISNDLMDSFFTLHQGDIIIKGSIDDDIDEYMNGKRSTDILAKYKEYGCCMVVKKWQDNTGKGRELPHYYVSGE